MAARAGAREPDGPRRGLAVLGGSFNPPHQTHLRLCRAALDHLPIDQVRVIPAADHPHKRDRDMAPAQDRVAMCRIGFLGLSGVFVDDRELHRTGPSYTVDTLAELAAEAPDRPLYFLIGSDNLPLLASWHDHHRLLALATVVTYPRLGHPIDAESLARLDFTPAERQRLLDHVLPIAASAIDDNNASAIRAAFRAGHGDRSALPPGVADYIVRHHLYR
jgi:nicotinate-nucleotide adenylyltransferase